MWEGGEEIKVQSIYVSLQACARVLRHVIIGSVLSLVSCPLFLSLKGQALPFRFLGFLEYQLTITGIIAGFSPHSSSPAVQVPHLFLLSVSIMALTFDTRHLAVLFVLPVSSFPIRSRKSYCSVTRDVFMGGMATAYTSHTQRTLLVVIFFFPN